MIRRAQAREKVESDRVYYIFRTLGAYALFIDLFKVIITENFIQTSHSYKTRWSVKRSISHVCSLTTYKSWKFVLLPQSLGYRSSLFLNGAPL